MRVEVDRFLQVLELERGFSRNTVVAYRSDLNQFVDFLSESSGIDGSGRQEAEDHHLPLRWSEVSERHLSQFLQLLHSRSYATSTVARKMAAIKSFFQFLRREGVMGEDPSSRVASPRVDKYTPRAISATEVSKLLEQPCGRFGERAVRPEALRDRAMLETLYATGMRVSELVALDLSDVDLTAGWVCCGAGSARERRVPLCGSALASLECYLLDGHPQLGSRESAALFLNYRGRRLTRQGFWLILKTYAERAEIADVTPHTLRHTFATQAIRQGTELRLVQHLLGHVSISTTQVYRRLVDGTPNGGEEITASTIVHEAGRR